ncbi:hypothetical protein NMG60_11014320 [Bertholletia excelsa]
MTPHCSTMKPSSIKTRFAHRFLKALKRLKNQRAKSTSTFPGAALRGYRAVKMAADLSLASAVGPRRAWSRAVLQRIRRRRVVRRMRSPRGLRRRKRVRHQTVTETKPGSESFDLLGKLRDLVPGGEEMDVHGLLEETAHYIKCLTTQVQVMRNIVDLCSN